VLIPLLVGSILAGILALGAWMTGHLSPSGALAAFFLGTLVFALGGITLTAGVLTFFLSSSLLSSLGKSRKAGANHMYAKNGRRDAAQVLANGGAAGLFIALGILFEGQTWPWIAAAASLAAANADTWATEVGGLSRSAPRLITSGKKVPPGTSGAISLPGTLAALGGSILIALVTAVVPHLRFHHPGTLNWLPAGADLTFQLKPPLVLIVLVAFSGLAGSLIDSLLGAALQAIYTCPACRVDTEKHPYHTCGNPTSKIRGISWINNDLVNLACTLSAAVLAAILQRFF